MVLSITTAGTIQKRAPSSYVLKTIYWSYLYYGLKPDGLKTGTLFIVTL